MKSAMKTSVLQSILVPIDFSDKSDQALDMACTLARVTRCGLTLLHVLELPYATEIRKEKLRMELEKSAKSAMKERLKRAKGQLARLKIPIQTAVVVGNPVHVIVETASAGKYDLICIGNRITNGLRRLVFDTTTSGVIDLAPCPVLATTAKQPTIDFQSMMFGTDFRAGDLQIIKRVSRLAAELRSKLTVVHISKKKTFEEELKLAGLEQLCRRELDYKDLVFKQYFSAEVESGIEEAVKNIQAGLVILSRDHRGLLDTLFGSDVVDDLVYKSEVPILVFPSTTGGFGA